MGGGKSLNKEARWHNSRVTLAMICACTDIPLQGLDRCALTVGAISRPHCQTGVLLGNISLVVDLHG